MPDTDLSQEEKKTIREDMEFVKHCKDYRRKFDPQMQRAAKVWNLLADPAPRDDISNVFIGIARMIALQAISSLSEGRPFFGFRPGSLSDYGKKDLWEAGVNYILDMNAFEAKQQFFFVDNVVLGLGIYEVVPQYPTRTVRVPNGEGFTEKQKRDFRRCKVEIRHRSPFDVWVDPAAATLDDVRNVWDEQVIDALTWKRDYVDAILPDGRKKYPKAEKVPPKGQMYYVAEDGDIKIRESDHKEKYCIGKLQKEDGDILRIYANGYPIYDAPLQIKTVDGERTTGMNPMGMHSFCFGPNEHQFDSNLRTHALYPMGLPNAMRGFDALYQLLTNMTVDNLRLQNTSVLSYQPFDGTSALDLDARDFYSGDFVDGKIDVQSLGNTRMDLQQAMWDQLDNWCIYLTGINFKQIFGEPSRTAFEYKQRIRAQNRRFEYKIRTLEHGCFRKLGQLLIGGAMSELTVEDYEEVTEKELEGLTKAVASGKMTGEDIRKEGDKITERKVYSPLRIKNRGMEENFKGKGSKRKFGVTLKDYGPQKYDSFIPSAPEYLWSTEYAERGGIPDVYVEGQRMIKDLQELRAANIQNLLSIARIRVQEDPNSIFDLVKIEKEYLRALGMQEELVSKEEQSSSQVPKDIFGKMKQILGSSPQLNALASAGVGSPQRPLPAASQQGPSTFGLGAPGEADLGSESIVQGAA